MAELHHVIVGAGHAGAMAAVELRKAGHTGLITLIGDETHLPYERPPLSKEMLLGSMEGPRWLHEQTQLDAADIALELGVAVRVINVASRRVVLADGRGIAYDRLLLATGGTARSLPVPGGELACTLRSYDDALHLKAALTPGRTVVVVGAGVIGLEVASTAAKLGCAVTVIEYQSGPMARSAMPIIQSYIDDLHARHGVARRYGVALRSIMQDDDGQLVLDIRKDAPLVADLVVAGIGLAPNLDLARAAGLAIDSGILVDERGETSVPGIFAAGDAVNFWHPGLQRHVHWQTWQHAQNHGKAVARVMAGGEASYAPQHWFWSDQHGVNLQFTGDPTGADETIVRGDPAKDRFAAFHRKDRRIIAATFVNSGSMVRPTQALIASGAIVAADDLSNAALPLQKLAKAA